MVKRTISGVVLTLVLSLALLKGGILLWTLLLLTSLAGVRELHQAVGTANDKLKSSRFDPMAVAAYILTVIYYCTLNLSVLGMVGYLLLGLPVLMLIYVAAYPRYNPVDIFCSYVSVIYVAILLSCIYTVRESENGVYTVWLIFIGSWICDTCAYFVGSAIGKHKLAPVLSPKKSVEGAVGGVLGSAIVGVLFAFLVARFKGSDFSLITGISYALICAIAAVFSQVGDLSASAIKRYFGIKDYGNIIPGHGGVLDRFDSVIMIAPLVLLLMDVLPE